MHYMYTAELRRTAHCVALQKLPIIVLPWLQEDTKLRPGFPGPCLIKAKIFIPGGIHLFNKNISNIFFISNVSQSFPVVHFAAIYEVNKLWCSHSIMHTSHVNFCCQFLEMPWIFDAICAELLFWPTSDSNISLLWMQNAIMCTSYGNS